MGCHPQVTQQNGKKLAAEAAVELIENGMWVGLGTGSTVYYAIEAIGRRIAEGLKIQCVCTSRETEKLAGEHGIPFVDINRAETLDIAIDGADEVDDHFNLIKGGGGALFREKMVASLARRFVIVVDASKRVQTLGKFKLPIEVAAFGHEHTARRIAALGCKTYLRHKDSVVYQTDNHNYIYDCDFGAIQQPAALHEQLKSLLGVVETGLFCNMANDVFWSDGEQVGHLVSDMAPLP